jgi:hypothetical protein
MCWFLHPFIWRLESGLMWFRDGSNKWVASVHQILCISWKSVMGPWQWLDKHSGNRAWAVQECLNGMLGSGQTEKGETDEEQIREHAHNFLWHQGNCSQRIRSGRPNSQLRILLWLLQWLCENVWRLHPEVWRQKNWLLHHDNTTLPFSTGNFLPKTKWLLYPTHPTHLTWSPVTFLYFPPFWRSLSDLGILKMAEALETAHTLGKGLLWGWWWPVSPKLVFG